MMRKEELESNAVMMIAGHLRSNRRINKSRNNRKRPHLNIILLRLINLRRIFRLSNNFWMKMK